MALTIDSTSSLQAQHQVGQTDQARKKTLARLSSGLANNSAADNAAAVAIAQGMSSQITGNNQAMRNANDGISMLQTADGALGQLQQNNSRIEELALQASNGILTDSNRQALQKEVDQLTQANSQIVQTTQFNGTPLLSGSNPTTFQVGADGTSDNQVAVSGANLAAAPASGGLNGYNANLSATGTIDISTQASALNALGQTRQDRSTLTQAQSQFGAAQNRFTAVYDTLSNTTINEQASLSRMNDTDYASATSELTRQSILAQSGVAALGQANISQSSALSLLKG
ncbi:flagellin N-terminal helical domain-containing protein [Paludibacterium paludis]|uniref:Flagellin n=1 Tax=Paludibacterium paludis TaxID=1225769 RepID=A0A918P226_9NEIS|nr:flagellin [Paludibacterium paludis]GGY13559.1 flagellin [Paludibacterium paludis]